ncbi:TetR family transcriptional regulator [Pantoea sp. Tr-811]|uniref:TetR family transcriptional regulator C-terminal domain-containing protein n=1 Tax=Pantoea sp. Tr-811 TaxID=2608361 RepID=UPI0014236633|nr:TetR family transcriptional regulator C-terminal domain-containing protein [Pantoea sp. Tr-811]NIF27647.1 TetR family transcriptional regulator [Pantoea sp. Tr-811]
MPFELPRETPKAPDDPAPDPVRRVILDAASEAFAQQGYAATKLSVIAALASLPRSNVLYYFKTKANLYMQVLADIAPRYLQACAPFQHGDAPLEALSRTVTSMLQLFEGQPFASKVFLQELKEGGRRIPGDFLDCWASQARQNTAQIRQWVDNGKLAAVNPEHVLPSVWAMAQSCLGRGWDAPRGGAQPFDYRVASASVHRLLSGLAPG